jgi:hypothetical protein
MPGNRITCNADLKSIAFVRQSRSEEAGFRHSCEGDNPLKATTWDECCWSNRLFAASLAQHTRVAAARPLGKLAKAHRNAVFLHPL